MQTFEKTMDRFWKEASRRDRRRRPPFGKRSRRPIRGKRV